MTDTALVAHIPQPPAAPEQVLDRLHTVRTVLAPDLNDQELQLFAMVAARSGLDPFAKQIYAIKRKGRVTFQTGIDGYRSAAERTGEYDGQDEPVYSADACPCGEKPAGHPEWAQVTVYRWRHGRRQGQPATAYWHEYKPEPGRGDYRLDQMWLDKPRLMLAKCAEALAFRKQFPHVLGDVYVGEEMARADAQEANEQEARRVAAIPTAADRLAARRAAIEAEPAAEGKAVEITTASVTEAPVTAPVRAQPADGGGEAAGEAAAAPTRTCAVPSPYEGSTQTCVVEVPEGQTTHAGNHRGANRESWAQTRSGK